MTRLHQSQRTWPMWRQFSSPTTSISLSPMSWLAPLSSALSFSPCGLRRDFFLCCLNTTGVTSLTMTVTDSPGLDAAVAPHVGAAVRARDVEQRDPLQLRALRQLQRLVVTLNNRKYLDICIYSIL